MAVTNSNIDSSARHLLGLRTLIWVRPTSLLVRLMTTKDYLLLHTTVIVSNVLFEGHSINWQVPFVFRMSGECLYHLPLV